MDVFWGVLAAGLLAYVFIWSLVDGSRHPDRWARLYDADAWRQAEHWIVPVWLAVLLTVYLLGAASTVLAVIGVVGVCAFYIAWRFRSVSEMNDRIRRFFNR
jgi:hypothetical protein